MWDKVLIVQIHRTVKDFDGLGKGRFFSINEMTGLTVQNALRTKMLSPDMGKQTH